MAYFEDEEAAGLLVHDGLPYEEVLIEGAGTALKATKNSTPSHVLMKSNLRRLLHTSAQKSGEDRSMCFLYGPWLPWDHLSPFNLRPGTRQTTCSDKFAVVVLFWQLSVYALSSIDIQKDTSIVSS